MSNAGKPKVKLGSQQQSLNLEEVSLALQKIESAIHAIYERRGSSLSFEELYRTSYNLVLQRHGDMLYDRVQECLRKHLDIECSLLTKATDAALLELLASNWKDQMRSLNTIKDVLMYLDKAWVPQHVHRMSVFRQGIELFLHVVLRNKDLYERVIGLILDRILRKRNGEMVDLSPIQTTYAMLLQMDEKRRTVDELFETPVLAASEQYFALQSEQKLASLPVGEYLRFVEDRLHSEMRTAGENYPDMSAKLHRLLLKELIIKHGSTLIGSPGSGLVAMVRENKLDDLRLLFKMLHEAHTTQLLDAAKIFGEHIAKTCLDIIQSPLETGLTGASVGGENGFSSAAAAAAASESAAGESSGAAEASATTAAAAGGGGGSGAASSLSQIAVDVVRALRKEKDKFDMICRSSFQSDKLFQKAMKEAFETSFNNDARCAQFLAIYCDELLTGKLEESKGVDIEPEIDRVMGLFRFLSDKDVFEAYYKQHLAKRLLGQRSISEDAERTVIAKLKSECGHQFTSKLEGMFKDMQLSQDASNKFRQAMEAKEEQLPMDFNVSVLASGFWPGSVHYQESMQIKLPPVMRQVKAQFDSYYNEVHTGRKLTWNYVLGSCEVKIHGFHSGSYDFTVSPLQCIAMLAFSNERRSMSFGDLLEATGIPREDLKRHMISMAVPKFQLFNKTGHKKEFLDEDVYEFNTAFKSRLRKIKIILVSMSGSSAAANRTEGDAPDVAAVPESVMEARKHIMEATIVRIMKSRKRMEHNNLLAEVFKQIRFKPSPQDVKKRVESLIERDYLERDPDDMRFYSYLA